MPAQFPLLHAGGPEPSGWLHSDGVDVAQFPKVADHRRRMAERPAVQRALA